MPTPKMFVRQFQYTNPTTKKKRTFMLFRYWDNHLKNYEYQCYELVIPKRIARMFGAPETKKENTRQMSDWLWKNAPKFDGVYVPAKKKA